MKRFNNITVTKEYIDLINIRLLNYGLRNEEKIQLPKDTSDI